MPISLSTTNRTKTLQAHLANGHIGLQGSDSGLAPARSFMIGISDLTPNDVYRMALLPTWNAVEVTIAGDSLSAAFARGDVEKYVQCLDLATACLRTQYRVQIGDVAVSVAVETWLSRADRFLACQTVTLSAAQAVTAQVRVGLMQNPSPARFPWRSIHWPHEDFPRQYGQGFLDPRMSYAWHPGHMEVVQTVGESGAASWAVAATALGHGPAVGVALALRADGTRIADAGAAQHAGAVLTVSLSPHETRRLEQFVAFSRDDRPAALAAVARQRAETARDRGYAHAWGAHQAAWRALWQGDVLVEGDETLARQARADLFALYQNAPVDDRYPCQIMGIASPGYFGGCFWDTDVYAHQAILPFRPELGRGTVRFRHRILPMAMKLAAQEGKPGARYAWISELVEGEENCVGHSELSALEIHLTADVALGVWSYFCASGDDITLRLDGWPVLEAVANYFTARVTWIPWEKRYELLHVHCAEEALGRVHNCLYTNAAVKRALTVAARAAEILGFAPPPAWRAVAEGLHIPHNRHTGLFEAHSAHDQPCPNRFLETNAVFIAGLPATPAQLRDIISVPPIHWDMSYQAAIAAMAGAADTMRAYLDFQATSFVHPEFLGRTEMPENDAGPYITGSAALVQNLLLGAGGLRWTEAGLTPTYAPCLPAGITRLAFPRLEWQEQAYAIEITQEHGMCIEPLDT